jgi:VIT1/CCC1 family predicted Fe2+/Mn2+ transporter
VAQQLTAHDALGAHQRDELGITDSLRARPLQAALSSSAAFSLGATLPIVAVIAAPAQALQAVVIATTLAALLLSGALAAWAGGASVWCGAWRVGFWGAIAMAAAAVVGRMFEVQV